MQSDAQKQATARYIKTHYDRIALQLPKGSREILSNHAKNHDKSVNAFLARAIAQTMRDDGANPADIAVILGSIGSSFLY